MLKACRECGGKVSYGVEKCPHCGCKCPGMGRDEYTVANIFGVIVVGCVVVTLFMVLGIGC